jgi:hypothetical protein
MKFGMEVLQEEERNGASNSYPLRRTPAHPSRIEALNINSVALPTRSQEASNKGADF